MASATTLSVPSQASAAQVAAGFGLSPAWTSSEPLAADPSTLASATNSTQTFELLQQRWNATGTTEATNAAWVADPFDGGNDAAVLRVAYPADSRDGAQFSMAVLDRDAGVQTALLKYEVRRDDVFPTRSLPTDQPPWSAAQVAFDSGFSWIRGGKLPGLYGAAPGASSLCSGGQHQSSCFSARLMWRNRGAGEVYAYIPTYPGFCSQSDVTCNDDYGTSLSRGAWTFSRGRCVALGLPF